MKVIFSHGKESGPRGSKIRRLAQTARQMGMAVDSIDYSDVLDPDIRVQRLLQALDNEDVSRCLLAGSSMGGYVSLVASQTVAVSGLFLLAPALYVPGYAVQHYHSVCSDIEVVHGWSDEVIPLEHSLRYARTADCTLHLVSGDHRLMSALERIDELFQRFLRRHREC